jgi:hypothetical protein
VEVEIEIVPVPVIAMNRCSLPIKANEITVIEIRIALASAASPGSRFLAATLVQTSIASFVLPNHRTTGTSTLPFRFKVEIPNSFCKIRVRS